MQYQKYQDYCWMLIDHSQNSSKQHYILIFQVFFLNTFMCVIHICNFICTILLDCECIFDGVTIHYAQSFRMQLDGWSFLSTNNKTWKLLHVFFFATTISAKFVTFICIILIDSSYNYDWVTIHYIQIYKTWPNGWCFLLIKSETLR